MLNNKIVFQRLMALLRAIDPEVPLPDDLEDYLWENMEVVPFCDTRTIMEREGEVPENALFVVRGYVLVLYYDTEKYEHVFRIYRANTIVALNCFMRQKNSKYTIVACKDTLVWSISNEHMERIYGLMDGMKDMAWKTSAAYSDAKELMHKELLAMPDEVRVWAFYTNFCGLLPAKRSPIRDVEIGDFLMISVYKLRRIRDKLRKKGMLEW